MPNSTLQYPVVPHRLDNGMRIIANPDPSSPAVAVNLWFRVGSANEEPGATGFAHLFEHLMFAGSAHVASSEHMSVIQAAGGTVNASTTSDRTNYYETLPSSGLDLALWLEADRVASLTVDQKNLDTQIQVVKEEKRQRYDNQPYGDLFEMLLAQQFPAEHPYRHPTIGSMSDLDAAAPQQVQEFFARWYSPSNASLVISGGVSADEALSLAHKHFHQIPSRPIERRPDAEPLPAHQGLPRLQVTRDVPRSILTLGWRVPSLGQPVLPVIGQAVAILADGQSSRLHKRLVRDLEIAESVNGSVLDLVQGTSLAVLSVQCTPDSSLDALEAECLQELGTLVADGPDTRELRRVTAQYEREWFSELASVDSRADAINFFEVQRGDAQLLNQHLEEVSTITTADIARAAHRWLNPENCAALHYLADTTSGTGEYC